MCLGWCEPPLQQVTVRRVVLCWSPPSSHGDDRVQSSVAPELGWLAAGQHCINERKDEKLLLSTFGLETTSMS